jgi:hypothetical protein
MNDRLSALSDRSFESMPTTFLTRSCFESLYQAAFKFQKRWPVQAEGRLDAAVALRSIDIGRPPPILVDSASSAGRTAETKQGSELQLYLRSETDIRSPPRQSATAAHAESRWYGTSLDCEACGTRATI